MPKRTQKKSSRISSKPKSSKGRKGMSTAISPQTRRRVDKAHTTTPILLVPGASATGRDFLLEQLLANTDILTRKLGFNDQANVTVAQKTTDRPAREGVVDRTKVCVTAEEFTEGLDRGDIIANYVLESTGKRYGYHKHAFNDDSSHVMVADASVYQLPAIKKEFGRRVYTAAMIATRDYRYENLTSRGSEAPEEVETRLNLGDAHVALLIMMGANPTISYWDFIDNGMAGLIDELLRATRQKKRRPALEQALEAFTGSRAVVDMVKELALDHQHYVDELVILGPEHKVSSGDTITETPFFDTGVNMLRNALDSVSH